MGTGSIISAVVREGWRNDVADGMHSDKFARTWGVVDATSDEVQHLWWTWSEHYRVPWTQAPMGSLLTIGYVDQRPIAVSTEWALIDGVRIAFIHGTSQLVDYEMIERWRSVVFGPHRHYDAANFGNAIGDIEETNGHQIFNRARMKLLESVLESDEILSPAARGLLTADPHAGFTHAEQKMQEWGERARRYQNLMRQEGLGYAEGQAEETTRRGPLEDGGARRVHRRARR